MLSAGVLLFGADDWDGDRPMDRSHDKESDCEALFIPKDDERN
mgnify:CR=1 FL=1